MLTCFPDIPSLPPSMAEKSKILIVGATGYIGRFLVDASTKAGHPTFAFVRETSASNPEKSKLLDGFKKSGVTLVYGDIYDHDALVSVIKQVDVVISAIGIENLGDQVHIISAIREAGNVKRFLPSEFGLDVDHVHAVEPAASLFGIKAKLRRSIEAEGIPHTYVVCNGFAGYFLPNLGQTDSYTPPREKLVIIGDGNVKVILVKEDDIAAYTIKAADDPRTLNKILYMRPPENVLSYNEIVSLWESKIGKTLKKTYILEDQLLKNIEEAPFPTRLFLAFEYSSFVKGDQVNFEIKPSFGVEATELYPEMKYTTVDEYLDQFA